MPVTGGHNLKRILNEALRAQGVEGVVVGFFRSAKYQDGTPVAAVAAWLEFGTRNSPEWAFFRKALSVVEDDVIQLIREGIDSETMQVKEGLADELGALVASAIQQSITDTNEPDIKESTKRRKAKKGGTIAGQVPLIDTGKMRASATWKVEK